jgi:hypothetical protein
MGGKKTRSYTPQPAIDPEVAPRAQAVLKVLSKQWTMTEAAENVGMSRNRFQTIFNRSLAAMLEELGQKPAGRPARAEKEKALEAEVTKLRRENAKLSDRVGTIDRLLGVASDMLKGRITKSGRQTGATSSSTSTSSSTETSGEPEDPDPDGEGRERLGAGHELRRLGLGPVLAAAVIGAGASTVRRWAAAARAGETLCRRRGRARAVPLDVARVALAEETVRALGGMIGADALRVSTGLSRREAGAVKAKVLTAIERERQEAAARVEVTVPGIVRGFDQVYAWTTEGWRFVLMSADACVPYRTGALVAEHYDEESVLAAIAADIAEHGPPLVWRMDRASCHRTERVTAYLESRGVLVLHGPPRHPQYYGQLERQNREHRAWLRALGDVAPRALLPACARMCAVLNARWPRRALGWMTPAEVWAHRRPIDPDLRAHFQQEVYARAQRVRAERGDNDLAMRLAIEQALKQRGFLRVERRDGAN